MQGKRKYKLYKIELVDLFLVAVLLFLVVFMLCTKGISFGKEKKEAESTAIVTERDMPLDYNEQNMTVSISIKDENNNEYVSNRWYKSLTIEFLSNFIVKELQWNKNGSWETICNDSSHCKVDLVDGVNKNMAFRTINYYNAVSYMSGSYPIKIDNTLPTCHITTQNSNGKVLITVNGSDTESGVYGIRSNSGSYEQGSPKSYYASKSGTYTFHIKDNVGNENQCAITLNSGSSSGNNQSTTEPKMTISRNGGTYTITNGTSINIDFKVSFGNTSNIKEKYYGWSSTEEVYPATWNLLTKENVTFRFQGGNHYFWTKVVMNNGKVYYYRTKVFMIQYQVTLNHQNNTANTVFAKTYNQTLAMPKVAPTRSGYTFLGWNTASDGSGAYYPVGSNYTNNEAITLYGIWKKADTVKTYTLSFNSNGGTSVSSKTVTNGSTYGTLPVPTRSGYTFLGWYLPNGSKITSSTIVNLTGNTTAVARWEDTIVTYTISFNSNGGSTTHSPKTVINGRTYGTLPTPYRSGYTFLGWYLPNGTKVESNTIVVLSGNTILTARWAKTNQAYTVYFNSNGGTSVSSKTVINGSTYGNLPTPTRSGYTFLGWYLNNTKITSGTKVSLTTNVTLLAKWQKNATTNVKVSKLYTPTASNPVIVCSEHATNCKTYLKGGNNYYAKQYAHMEIYDMSSSIENDTIILKISYKIYSGMFGTYNRNVKTQMYLTSYQQKKAISSNLFVLRNGEQWGTGTEGVSTVVSSGTVSLKVPVANVSNGDYINVMVYSSNANGYVDRYSFVSPYLFQITK